MNTLPGARAFSRADRRTPALALLSLLQFLIALDVTVVNVALPSIGERFHASAASLSWVVTGYTLVGGGLLLLGGRITDLLGRRRMFLLGAGLFALASLTAGAAPTLPVLVLARFAQGAGEALASPAAMSLIALLFPAPAERAKALGVWGVISSGGLVAGVLLSGFITELLHWRWIFGINVPLAAGVLLLAPKLLPADGPRAHAGRLDLPGAALLTAGPLCLVHGVMEAAPHTITAGVLLLAAFVVVEARTRHPLMPLSLLTHRVRAVANGVTALLSAALSTAFFLLTLYMQDVMGLGPLRTGLAFLPFCAVLLLAVSRVARLVEAFGTKYTALTGLACTAAGLAWLARLPGQGAYALDVLPGMTGIAAGMGIGLVALQNAALSGVTDHDAGTAAGIQRSVDQLGGSLGLAVLVGLSMGPGDAGGFRTAFLHATAAVAAAAVLLLLAARDGGAADDRADPGDRG
ncbi:MFS transporter [Streptomyces nitrosporeus]|uniref:MFS transporter n=1 Tax=Streptomyces nitrosporeus TaxID=28894 RepID=A0A5J6F6G2_9ACTN|nr:MFS transporter [Streptomyces nitrosporeus]QEU71899.1 MFS transporter [Streptomyces nitrosporeus]GGY93252.1 MFS transporter [Streptomyces nitrosporeus]